MEQIKWTTHEEGDDLTIFFTVDGDYDDGCNITIHHVENDRGNKIEIELPISEWDDIKAACLAKINEEAAERRTERILRDRGL
jgi:hypothetical protein